MPLSAKPCYHSHEEAWKGLRAWEDPLLVHKKVLECLETCPLRIGNLACAHKPGTVSWAYLENIIKRKFPTREKELRSQLALLDYLKVYIDQSYRFYHWGNLDAPEYQQFQESEPKVEEMILKCPMPENWKECIQNIKYGRDNKQYDENFKNLLRELEELVVWEYNEILADLRICEWQ